MQSARRAADAAGAAGVPIQLVFMAGALVTGIGLHRLSGIRPLPWLAAGTAISVWGGKALALTGDWTVGDVNLRFIPGYALYLIGAGLIVKAWALAFEPYPVGEEQVADEVPQPAI